MFVLDLVPAWLSNRIKGLVKAPKRYLVDPALAAAVLGLGREAILYGPDMLGPPPRYLRRRAVARSCAQSSPRAAATRVCTACAKNKAAGKLDLLIETAGGQLTGIEIKAAATVRTSDARHLAWLRGETGDAFATGIIMHTGPHVFPVSGRIIAAQVSALWS